MSYFLHFSEPTTTDLLTQLKAAQAELSQLKHRLNLTQHTLSQCSCPHTLLPNFQGHEYKLSPALPWNVTKMESYCQELGGYLAEIDNEAEYRFVVQMMKKKRVFPVTRVVFLGARDLKNDGKFIFINSGKPATFFAWQKNRPTEPSPNDCVGLWRGTSMSNVSCQFITKAISRALCEIPV